MFANCYLLFFFKLRESLQRSLKIIFNRVLVSRLSRKTFNSPKNFSWTKKLYKEWFGHAIPRADDNSDVCQLLFVNKLKRKCLYLANITKHVENGSSCTVKLCMYLGGLLSSQELGEVLVRLTSSACSKGIWSTLTLFSDFDQANILAQCYKHILIKVQLS